MKLILPWDGRPASDAEAAHDSHAPALAQRPASLNGKVVGFLDGWGDPQAETDPPMYPLMREIAAFLEESCEIAETRWVKKPSIASPLTEEELEEFLSGVDVVVNGECV